MVAANASATVASTAEKVVAAEAKLEQLDTRLGRLRAELVKVEAARAAAAEEAEAAKAAHEAAVAAAEERARMAKRWHPPCDAAARAKALGEQDTPLARCWDSSAPLPLPPPGSWLAKGQPGEADRPGQTVAQFCRPGRSVPSPMQRYIYLVPLGAAPGAPPSRTLCDFLGATFGIEVRPGEAVAAAEVARVSSAAGEAMLVASELNDLLAHHKPKDALLVLGYTMEPIAGPEPTAPARANEAAAAAAEEEASGGGAAPAGFEVAAAHRKTSAALPKPTPAGPKPAVPTFGEV